MTTQINGLIQVLFPVFLNIQPGNTKWGSIPVLMTSCLTGLESAVLLCLSKVSMLKKGKLARLIFSKVKSLVH